jgi:hypothetical protein
MKPTRFEMVVLLIATGIIIYQIFIPPLIGLADSGDFGRLLPQRGLAHVSSKFQDNYFSYFNSKYQITPKWEGPDWYKSSTSLLIRTARWVSIRVGQEQIFDIRFLAAFYAFILLFGIWLILVAARSLSRSLRIVVAGLLIVIFTDAGYVAYFNSFYSEGTALSFLAVAIGCGLILIAGRSSSLLLIIGYFLAIAMLVSSKPMYTALALVFALFGIYLSRYIHHASRYWVSGGLAIALCCLTVWYYNQTPEIIKVHGAYVGIFMDLLPNSSTKQEDLIELGLNPNYALFSKTTPYQPDSPLNDPKFETDFSTKVKSSTLPLFYVKHPRRLYSLFARCMKHTFSTRVRRLGYYEATTGKPPLAKPFGIWSAVRENVFPRSLIFIALFFSTAIAAIVLFIRTSSATVRSLHLLYLLFISIAGAQFLIAILAGGGEPDLAKHLFMFNLAFDVCLILVIFGAVYLFQTSGSPFLKSIRRSPSAPQGGSLIPADRNDQEP